MSYGLKIFNLVEETGNELTSGTIKVFYEAKQVDDLIRSLKAKNNELQRNYDKAMIAANEKIAEQIDGNAKYWKELCEKRTKMYLEEQAAHASVAEQLQIEIHKPFQHIEKLKVMKIALYKIMAETAYYHSRYLELWLQFCCLNEEAKREYEPKLDRKRRQLKLFRKKAYELERELNDELE